MRGAADGGWAACWRKQHPLDPKLLSDDELDLSRSLTIPHPGAGSGNRIVAGHSEPTWHLAKSTPFPLSGLGVPARAIHAEPQTAQRGPVIMRIAVDHLLLSFRGGALQGTAQGMGRRNRERLRSAKCWQRRGSIPSGSD